MKQAMTGLWAAILVCGAVVSASAGDSASNVTPDTIAYWPFDKGTELADATGNGHALTNSGVTFSAEAAVFNGAASSKLVTLSTLPFSTYSNLTIECFFNMSVNDGGFNFFFSTGATYATPGSINFYQTSGTVLIGDFFNPGGVFDQESSELYFPVGMSSWHHAAIVIDSNKSGTDPDRLQLYIDSIRMRSTYIDTTHVNLSDALLYIGTLGTQAGYHLTGQMDDIRITAAALAPSEFLQTQMRTVSTTAYWPFNPGEELLDTAGNDHTLSSSSVTFTNGAARFSSALSSGLSTYDVLPFEDSIDQTIEFFFCTTSQTGIHRMMLMTGELNNLPGTLLCYGDPDTDNLSYDIFNSGGDLHKRLATGGINDGKWHHVALQVDSSKIGSERLKMYVDRAEQPVFIAQCWDAVLLNKNLHLGKAMPDKFFFDGQMDDVRITAAALSPGEFLAVRTRTANTNCIAYWPFNPGDELADASGNGHTLSNNQVSFANGAACFNSALSSRLATLSVLPFEDLDDVTIEFYFCTTNLPPATRMLLMTGDSYGQSGTLTCYGQANQDSLEVDFYDSGKRLDKKAANGNINDGKWHHVAIQIDSSTFGSNPKRLKMYVDRVEQPFQYSYINSLDPVLRNSILYLGTQGLQDTAFFDGRMDDVRITGRLLSTSEFMSPMERSVDYDCIAYWPFKAGQELEDASGNGHTLVNNHVTFQAGYALFDKELSAHLVTATKIPFNDPVDLTLEYFVRTSYAPLGFSAFTHTGPVYGVPGTFSSYINGANQLECDTWQIAGDQYNQERSSPGLLTDGEWHHVALVLERSAFETDPQNWFRLYVDGERELDATRIFRCTNPFLANNKFYLGCIGEIQTGFFEGTLDDVRITGKALTPSEFMSQRSKSEGTLLLLR